MTLIWMVTMVQIYQFLVTQSHQNENHLFQQWVNVMLLDVTMAALRELGRFYHKIDSNKSTHYTDYNKASLVLRIKIA